MFHAQVRHAALHAGPERETLLQTFHELHQQIRWNADEQAADAVLELVNA